MARAIWKGVIKFEDVEVPVKLYSAVSDRGVHFRLLHEKDLVPVKQRMVHPGTGQSVDYQDVMRGLEVTENVLVAFDKEELEELAPPPSRDIEITRFVDPSVINHQWYVRPYYLGPDGQEGAYTALARALGRANKEGVARWVMRKKPYLGALRSLDDHLVMMTLRHADEVVRLAGVEPPERAPTAGELKLAEQLISALEAELDLSELHDDYRERILELIKSKAAGEKMELGRFEREPAEAKSLSDALRASIDATRRTKVG